MNGLDQIAKHYVSIKLKQKQEILNNISKFKKELKGTKRRNIYKRYVLQKKIDIYQEQLIKLTNEVTQVENYYNAGKLLTSFLEILKLLER